jgi:hypothetical protein
VASQRKPKLESECVDDISRKNDEGLKVAVVTHGGDRTGTDMMNQGKQNEQWARKLAEHIPTLNPQQEKETYQ